MIDLSTQLHDYFDEIVEHVEHDDLFAVTFSVGREFDTVARRHRSGWAVALAVTAAALILGGVVAAAVSWGTDEPPVITQPEPTPTTLQGRIVFLREEAIYAVDPDGSNVTLLADLPARFVGFPAWSPDGTRIAFVAEEGPSREQSGDEAPEPLYGAYVWDIYVMNADGTGFLRLTDTPGLDGFPAWSPDGNRIAFESERDGKGQIYVMDADGSNVTRLANSEGGGKTSWSPDGTRIAFTSTRSGTSGGSKVHVMSADGSNVTWLGPDRTTLNPVWSPDGTRIAFTVWEIDPRKGEGSQVSAIYVMDADGSNVASLWTGEPTGDSSPAWSPDGRHIVFSSGRVGTNMEDIWIMNADGTGRIRVTETGENETDPVWQS